MGENVNALDTAELNENLQMLKIEDLKVGMILAETIEISKNKFIKLNESISLELIELLENQENLDEICVYKTKKYYNSDFETPEITVW